MVVARSELENTPMRARHDPRHIAIGPLTIGNDLPFVLIAGPCQIESHEHALETAAALVETCRAREVGLIYKSSFDKANRTSAESARGLGLAKGIAVLAEVRERYGCPVITDVHESHQCRPVAEAVRPAPSRTTALYLTAVPPARPVRSWWTV